MVRFTLKRSLRAESCCSLLVVNGGAALRRRSLRSTVRTSQSAFSTAARIFSASSPFGISIFSSPLPRKRASNAGGLLAARCASMVQYSFFSNALISRSRSTISRRATVCTRPADKPRRTLSQQWRNLIADETIEHAPCLLRVHKIFVNISRVLESLLHGALGNLVKGHAADALGFFFPLLLGFGAVAQLVSQVSSDGFAFAVRVRRQINHVRRTCQLLQPGD